MHKNRTRRITAAALAIPLLLAALAACGTGGGSPDADGGGSGATDQSFDDYQLEFASCMREQGIDMPDPAADGSIQAQQGEGFMEAAEACQAELGEPPAPPDGGEPEQSEEERQAEMLELAACFRENGVDVPDPAPGEMVTIPMDAPDEVFEECAPNGFGGAATSDDAGVPATGDN